MWRSSLIVLSLFFAFCTGSEDDHYEEDHALPKTCTGNDFFVKMMKNEMCQPCLCMNDKWVEFPILHDGERCCMNFGIHCLIRICQKPTQTIVEESNFTVNCECDEEGHPHCYSWNNVQTSCALYGKLCQCDGDEEKTVPVREGCYRCKCKNRFWECDKNHVYNATYCCYKWDVHCPKCCPAGHLTVSLSGQTLKTHGWMDGILIAEADKGKGRGNVPCSASAVVRAEFNPIAASMCGQEPFCGRRQLRISVKMHDERVSPFMDVIDGDGASVRDYDSELVGEGRGGCDMDPLKLKVTKEYFAHFANGFVKIHDENGKAMETCDKCLFKLSKENDNFLYIGLNRLVDGTDGIVVGSGVCEASFHWYCSGNKHDWREYVLEIEEKKLQTEEHKMH
ncbi:hypothetical protein ScPMuIL_003066 [Solemya velum]